MFINFNCILSILEKSDKVKLLYVSDSLDKTRKLYTFLIKGVEDSFTFSTRKDYRTKCCKYCDIIQQSEITYILEEHSNSLKNILKEYNQCIIENELNGCQFEKEECFKNAG